MQITTVVESGVGDIKLCMLTADDGSELAKIHKVKVLRNDRRQGQYTLRTFQVSYCNVCK